MKFVFIAGLFTVFVITFARPSIKKYMFAGVIVEKSSVKREIKDSPAITLCALNEDNVGWKNTVGTWVQYGAWVDIFWQHFALMNQLSIFLRRLKNVRIH